MRLWSLHPELLDAKGLVACWRETLLAQKTLAGQTAGYVNHPQLVRFRASGAPLRMVGAYLQGLHDESLKGGYRFDQTKILHSVPAGSRGQLAVTSGQLNFEYCHLLRKLEIRAPESASALMAREVGGLPPHPLFRVVPGPVEAWEKDVHAADE
ncbi:DNA lyase [Arthrobacter sp. MYb211]|uniref:pyrimidine dimer DNA glycosylase/endonuclease V n=1 Tax=unclassified Arthrobacter TaxID=235627 RepID=UPI000CFB4229|nr:MULTISPECIES: pyrimidine dimer DNA glycosylase/endonuclease V [unclassified Arthrobacter]PRA11852.1 DNA lyase [Arthrobacter sp. MYb221]PRC08208.1 DNA lyase [Arthrobacter sp. MYb211]